jgi:hypothetical protein
MTACGVIKDEKGRTVSEMIDDLAGSCPLSEAPVPCIVAIASWAGVLSMIANSAFWSSGF